MVGGGGHGGVQFVVLVGDRQQGAEGYGIRRRGDRGPGAYHRGHADQVRAVGELASWWQGDGLLQVRIIEVFDVWDVHVLAQRRGLRGIDKGRPVRLEGASLVWTCTVTIIPRGEVVLRERREGAVRVFGAGCGRVPDQVL